MVIPCTFLPLGGEVGWEGLWGAFRFTGFSLVVIRVQGVAL